MMMMMMMMMMIVVIMMAMIMLVTISHGYHLDDILKLFEMNKLHSKKSLHISQCLWKILILQKVTSLKALQCKSCCIHKLC